MEAMTFGHADNYSLNMEVHVRLVANDRKGKARHVKCQATEKKNKTCQVSSIHSHVTAKVQLFENADNDSLNMEVHVRLVANHRKGKARHIKCQATGKGKARHVKCQATEKAKQDMSSVRPTLTCDCQSPAPYVQAHPACYQQGCASGMCQLQQAGA